MSVSEYGYERQSSDTPSWKKILWFGYVAFALWCCAYAYFWLDDEGYLPHNQVHGVVSDNEWESGEIRTCSMEQRDAFSGKLIPEKSRVITCNRFAMSDPTAPRYFKVRFWGRVDREYPYSITWTCEKDSDVIECKDSKLK